MSWCRWGSVCTNTFVDDYSRSLNEACVDCLGSSLYIYEGSRFTCMVCALWNVEHDLSLHGDGSDVIQNFECDTPLEMYWHVLAHEARGDHVRRSLVHAARVGVWDASG